jgi:hypothetical protein
MDKSIRLASTPPKTAILLPITPAMAAPRAVGIDAPALQPAADAWTTLAPLPVAVSDDYATVALSGKIYVFGGTNNIGPGTTMRRQLRKPRVARAGTACFGG